MLILVLNMATNLTSFAHSGAESSESRYVETTTKDYFRQIPNEVLSMIFMRLSFPDLVRCLRLCKRFKTMLTAQGFWRNYLDTNFNFVPVKLDSTKLESSQYINFDLLMNEWWCYWDDSCDNPGANDPTRYIFRPFPQVWSNGIITPGDFKLFAEDASYDYFAFSKALHLLLALRQKCDEFDINSVPYYSTMDSLLDICLLPWQGDKLPTPEDVLEIFNVHKEIVLKSDMADVVNYAETLPLVPYNPGHADLPYDEVIYRLINTFSYINENEEHADDLFIWLQKLFQPSLMFCCGVNTIYPQLYFHLTILSPGWVGGVFTTIGLV